mgnify:CR=1 FL=1
MRNLHNRYQKFLFINILQLFSLHITENNGFMQYTLITNFHSPTPLQSSPSSTLFPYKNRKQNLKFKKKEKQTNGNRMKQTNRRKVTQNKHKKHMCMQTHTFTITLQNKAEQQVCNGLWELMLYQYRSMFYRVMTIGMITEPGKEVNMGSHTSEATSSNRHKHYVVLG